MVSMHNDLTGKTLNRPQADPSAQQSQQGSDTVSEPAAKTNTKSNTTVDQLNPVAGGTTRLDQDTTAKSFKAPPDRQTQLLNHLEPFPSVGTTGRLMGKSINSRSVTPAELVPAENEEYSAENTNRPIRDSFEELLERYASPVIINRDQEPTNVITAGLTQR